MRIWMLIRLALGGLRRRPLRVILTALGVAIGSGALVSMVGFALGVQKQAETPFKMLGLVNNIEVRPKDADDSEDAPVLDDATLERMEALPGVALAYPDFRFTSIKVVLGERSEQGLAFGMPREASLTGLAPDLLVAGGFFTLGDRPEVILGDGLSKKLGFEAPEEAVGSTVTVEAAGLTPEEAASFRFERKEFTVTVVGVYRMPRMGPRFVGNGVLLPVELMKQIPGVQSAAALENLRSGKSDSGAGYQRATVRVEHISHLTSVEREIQEMGFKTHQILSRLEKARQFFVFIDVLLAAVGTVALVVAGLGIVNTLLMSVLERYREIGVYKAIGASDADLLVLFLTEAGMIGLLGGLGGLALGRVVSWLLEIAVNVYAKGQGVTEHMAVFAFPFWLLASAVGFAVVISILSGLYPALRAARVDPIKALRAE